MAGVSFTIFEMDVGRLVHESIGPELHVVFDIDFGSLNSSSQLIVKWFVI